VKGKVHTKSFRDNSQQACNFVSEQKRETSSLFSEETNLT